MLDVKLSPNIPHRLVASDTLKKSPNIRMHIIDHEI